MSDRLYLSIWFPSFTEQEMLPRLLSVLKQFPYSGQKRHSYLAVRSVAWEEPLIFEQTFDYRVDPERALALAANFCTKTMPTNWTHSGPMDASPGRRPG